jgi:hypothetical protein
MLNKSFANFDKEKSLVNGHFSDSNHLFLFKPGNNFLIIAQHFVAVPVENSFRLVVSS